MKNRKNHETIRTYEKLGKQYLKDIEKVDIEGFSDFIKTLFLKINKLGQIA